MTPYLLVALGSALGGVCRFACVALAVQAWGPAFPWGTLIVNVAGSAVIGFVATSAETTHPSLRQFIMPGFCGGFTTFSAFSLETMNLLRTGDWPHAAANSVASVAFSVGAVWAGHALALSVQRVN